MTAILVFLVPFVGLLWLGEAVASRYPEVVDRLADRLFGGR